MLSRMVKSILKEKFHKPFRDTLLLLISSELNFANFAGIKFRDLAIKKMLKETKFREILICIYKLLVSEFAQLISLSVAIVSNVSEQNCSLRNSVAPHSHRAQI